MTSLRAKLAHLALRGVCSVSPRSLPKPRVECKIAKCVQSYRGTELNIEKRRLRTRPPYRHSQRISQASPNSSYAESPSGQAAGRGAFQGSLGGNWLVEVRGGTASNTKEPSCARPPPRRQKAGGRAFAWPGFPAPLATKAGLEREGVTTETS